MARKVHGTRALLNLPGHHSTAVVIAEIENTANWQAGKGRGGEDLSRYNCAPESTFQIADCDTKVTLEIDMESANHIANTLYKIDTLIDALRKLRRGVVIESERYVKRAEGIPTERRYGL